MWDYAWSKSISESPCDTPPIAEGFACENEENSGCEPTIVRRRSAAGKSWLMASVSCLHGSQKSVIRTNASPNETTKETQRPDASKKGDDPPRTLAGIRWRFIMSAERNRGRKFACAGRHGELDADKISKRS